MELANLIGAAAAVASVSSFGPQAWKVIKTRDTSSLSAGMYAITVTGFALWFAYGIMLGQWPLIVTNLVCLLLSGFILGMIVAPQRAKEKVADSITE